MNLKFLTPVLLPLMAAVAITLPAPAQAADVVTSTTTTTSAGQLKGNGLLRDRAARKRASTRAHNDRTAAHMERRQARVAASKGNHGIARADRAAARRDAAGAHNNRMAAHRDHRKAVVARKKDLAKH